MSLLSKLKPKNTRVQPSQDVATGEECTLTGAMGPQARAVSDLLSISGVSPQKALRIIAACEKNGYGDLRLDVLGGAEVKRMTPTLVKAGLPVASLAVRGRQILNSGFDRSVFSGLTISGLGEIVSQIHEQSAGRDFSALGYEYSHDLVKSKHGGTVVRITGLKVIRKDVLFDLIIPEEIDGHTVGVIAKSAFSGCDSINSVYIPECVYLVGAFAFENCSNLENVELPWNLGVIQQSTFAGCVSLRRVVLPYDLTRIEKNAFSGCASLCDAPHNIKRGIGLTERIDRNFLESKLPSSLEYIGPGAFQGCSAYKDLFLPYKVTEIKKDAFRDCSGLVSVGLHAHLKSIDDGAFAGCSRLKTVRIPDSLSHLGEGAFDSDVELIFSSKDLAAGNALPGNLNCREANAPRVDLTSLMVPGCSERFYSDEDLACALETFELRSVAPRKPKSRKPESLKPGTSRFVLEDGVYKAKSVKEDERVLIRMTGDLMCRPLQQKHAVGDDGTYDFSFTFSGVSDLLKEADITIGNMESMSARSFILSSECDFVDDRVHLNAPERYIKDVANAGYDVVVNAQNHSYDVGLQGIFETIDTMNKQGLIHTGLFVSESDQRYVLLEANGIKIGLVSYLDQARQPMKRANYTEKGLSTVFSVFDENRIREEVAAVRAAGAEFVIAYCHWGREYTVEITDRQKNFATMVADAGVDFILGSHSHNIQPFTKILAKDGREVPCLYSAGNFVSDMSIYLPGNVETLIVDLELVRDPETAKVVIAKQGYHPCLICRSKEWRGFVRTLSLAKECRKTNDKKRLAVNEKRAMRIAGIIGDSDRFPCLDKEFSEGCLANSRFLNYEVRENSTPMIKIEKPEPKHESKFERVSDGVYKLKRRTALSSAVLAFTGFLDYAAAFEADLAYGDKANFRSVFSQVKPALEDSDLAFGTLTSPCSSSYFTSGRFPSSGAPYKNADMQYVDAIKYAGFDCVSVACKTMMDCGAEGFGQTIDALKKHALVPVGENAAAPVFDVNDIRLCILAYSCSGGDGLPYCVYSAAVLKEDIKRAKGNGVEFVFACIEMRTLKKEARMKIAREAADAGVDYLVCGTPQLVSGYKRIVTADGRGVPVVSSTGTFASGRYRENREASPIIRLSLMKNEKGEITISDAFVPAFRTKKNGGVRHAISLESNYYSGYSSSHNAAENEMKQLFEGGIEADSRERRKVADPVNCQISPKQVGEIIGIDFPAEIREKLGEQFEQPAQGVIGFAGGLRKGCIAFEFDLESKDLNYDVAVEKGAILVVSKHDHVGPVPVLLVDNVTESFEKCMRASRNLFAPLVVGITGTMGKTTTKEFMHCVFEEHFRTLCIEGNNNTVYSSGVVLQKLNEKHEAYIQEIHGGTFNHASRISRIILPKIAVITGIGPGHLEQLGTIDNIVKEKMRIIDGLREDGVLILNNDSPELAAQNPSCRVLRCSATDTACDYYAKDVYADGSGVWFTICCHEGEYPAFIKTPGVVNVSNALVVFAAGREAGIAPEEIIKGLSKYHPKAERSNIIDVGGYTLLVDCYNSNPKALLESVKTLCDIPVREGGRRIAVLGDMGELADDADKIHFEVGEKIAEEKIDLVICCGELSRHLAAGVKRGGAPVIHTGTQEEMNIIVADVARPGDAILFKASHSGDFLKRVVNPLFGAIS